MTRRLRIGDVRRIAGPRVRVSFDRDCDCYRATCLPGFAFDEGHLHELVAVFEPRSGSSRSEALADLAERLRPESYRALACRPCRRGECEWSGSTPLRPDDGETTIDVETILPSSVSGCESGVDLDVCVTRADGDSVDVEVTLLPPPDDRDPRPFVRWGSADHWCSDPSRLSDDEIDRVAEVAETAAAAWAKRRADA